MVSRTDTSGGCVTLARSLELRRPQITLQHPRATQIESWNSNPRFGKPPPNVESKVPHSTNGQLGDYSVRQMCEKPTFRPSETLPVNTCTLTRTNFSAHGVLSRMSSRSFKQNFSHHSLVFVIQEMTVEDRHSSYHRVCKIHNHVDGAAVGNIDRVQP